MFSQILDKLIGIVKSRMFFLSQVFFLLFLILTVRLFTLQIIRGEEYLNNFTLKIEREKTIKSTRGAIYDRNGQVLANDELAYSVIIEDNYDSTSRKNMELNRTILELIRIVEKNGDRLNSDFNITLSSTGQFDFTLEGTRQLRFLADIYGHNSVDQLKNRERNATAAEVISYLADRKKFGIGEYTEKEDGTLDFVPMEGYTRDELLKVVTVRYNLNLNSFQKYLATTVATNVSPSTVAEIMENKDRLQGVDIAEDTVRRYIDDPSFSHILGYTGKISEEELSELNTQSEDEMDVENYELNDMVGKAGIEQVMERKLQGRKGRQTIFVDNLGRVTETGDKTDPVAGNALYLTIDADLQKAVYRILEQKIAGILISKIRDERRSMMGEPRSSANIVISIDDVYFALFDNNFINLSHLSSSQAGPNEQAVYSAFLYRLELVRQALQEELLKGEVAFGDLSQEMKVYESYVVSKLQDSSVGILDREKIDQGSEIFLNWRSGSISLKAYLEAAVSEGWIDTTKMPSSEKYLDSSEIYSSLMDYIDITLASDPEFAKKVYQFMIRDDVISGRQIIHILYEQGALTDHDNVLASLDNGVINAYHFMIDRIRSLEITPADLALDPFSGSCVVTDVNTGEILACVSYPSYDNSRFANSVDAAYYESLRHNKALPLYNYATQERTAPGSTFKPVSATAALEENVVGLHEIIDCEGVFPKIGNPEPKCWIYPNSTHGNLDISGAIQNSCNFFFYEVGYRLSLENGHYNSDQGVERMRQYVDLYGLTEKSGIEITESEPKVSNQDAVRSAIGQGSHSYTTVGLSRYVTAVANKGTCYQLSLLGYLTDAGGNTIIDYQPEIRNSIHVASSTWDAIHRGMRSAVEHYGAFEDFTMTAGGKTGTAQESGDRPNHALFIGFAPYNKPEISVASRIAYGYTSSNAAEVSRDVFRYYFNLEDRENLITGEAVLPDSAAIGD